MRNGKTNKSLKLAIAGALTLFMSNASATLISGVGAAAFASNASNCPSYCTSANGGEFTYSNDGGERTTNAYTTLNDYGYARAYSSFVDDSFLPILKVKANAGEGKKASATAWSVQNYTNTGFTTKTIDLDVNLHGSVASNAGSSSNNLEAKIAILSGTSLEWNPHFGTLVYEIAEFGGNSLIQDPLSLFISSGNNRNESATISFDIAAGESFFIVSEMNASSRNGYADAWNTLSMTFQNGSNLQAAIQTTSPTNPTSVPEPETLFLFALGLTGVALRSRKA